MRQLNRVEIVRWVSENKQPFNIISDRSFQSLMKTRRPKYYIPSPTTVSCDVKQVFANVCKCMVKMLQEHEGDLNFATDVWTSLNHKAFVAVTVHFQINGAPVSMLSDLKEVATSHSGLNLATAFAQILDEFDISTTVSDYSIQ
jgi:hypothetical protein